MESQDLGRIRAAVQALNESMQKVGASMYEEPGTPPPPDSENEDVVDGEFTEA
jgi:hypothetical protein